MYYVITHLNQFDDMEKMEEKEKFANDLEFVRLLKQNNEEALDHLWEALFRDSSKIARKYNQPEDLGYDAAVRAYSKLISSGIRNFKFNSAFRSYCWTIISREMFRIMKKEVVLEELELNKHASPEPNEKLADKQTIILRIQPCIEELKGNRLKVFELVDLAQESPGDVANKLGLSRNNVNKIASRVRLQLRQCLQRHGFISARDVLAL